MTDNATVGVHVAAANIVDLTAADILTSTTLTENSDVDVPSQRAVKTYADTKVSKAPAGDQTITNSHQLINAGGFNGPLVGAAQEAAPTAKTVSGAIAEKTGIVRLGSSGALAMSLADPTTGAGPTGDDGKRLTIIASTGHAHVVTVTGGLAGGTDNTVTLGGAAGDMFTLIALSAKWYLDGLGINATPSHV